MKSCLPTFSAFLLGCFFLIFSQTALAQTNTDTLRILACNHFWKTGAPVPAMTNDFYQMASGVPFLVNAAGGCTEYSFAPGVFHAPDFCPGGFRDSDAANGVTVADILKVIRHIQDIQTIQPRIVQLAADVNLSNTITSTDIGFMAKLILRVYPELPNNTSWRSWYNGLVWNSPTNVFAGWTCTNPFDLAAASDTIEQIAFKYGDLDGDANPAGPYQVPQTLPSATLSVPDWTLQAGETVEVPVYMAVDQPFFAIQTGFDLDHNLGNFMGMSDGTISPYFLNIGIFQDAMTFLNFSTSNIPIDYLPGSPLFYLKIHANQTFQIKNALSIDTGTMPALWVDTNDSIHPFTPLLSTTPVKPEPSAGIHTSPPSPNPFHDRTSIQVNADAPAKTRLEVLDATGRMLWTKEFYLNAGGNTLGIPGDILPEGGLAFYRLYTADWMVSGKLIRK